MTACHHSLLELLPEKEERLRCRVCYLTISTKELHDGYCPECFDRSGEKQYQFDKVESSASGIARYRCDECGAIVTTS